MKKCFSLDERWIDNLIVVCLFFTIRRDEVCVLFLLFSDCLWAFRDSISVRKVLLLVYEFWCFVMGGGVYRKFYLFHCCFFLNNSNNNNSMFAFMYILYIMEHSVTLAGCSPIEFPVARLSLASILFFVCFVYVSK